MDSKLEAHIDEIFQDVPKTDKMVTMINRIKSKANSKYLQTREQGYSRSVAFNEVDDWLMKAKVIVDEEAGKLTPAEIAAIPKAQQNDKPGKVVATASMDGEASPAVVVERDDAAPVFAAPAEEPVYGGTPYGTVDMSYGETAPVEEAPAPAPIAPAVEAPVSLAEAVKPATKEKKEKAVKEPKQKGKKGKKNEVEEDEIEAPVTATGKTGKIIGAVCLVAGVALIIVAVLILMGIIG